MLYIRAGHLELHGSPRPEDERVRGLYVAKDGFKGMESQVAMRRTRLEIPNGHGNYTFAGKLDARSVPLDVWAVTDGDDELQQLNIEVKSLGARGGSFRTVFEFRGLELWADGQIGVGGIQFVDTGGFGRARVNIPLDFPNPRLFGETRRASIPAVGQSAEISHEGNFEGHVVATIVGNFPGGVTLADAGGAGVTVSTPVTGGSEVKVNLATGWVWKNGVRQLRAVPTMRPFVAPGNTPVQITLTAPSGAGSAELELVDTYN